MKLIPSFGLEEKKRRHELILIGIVTLLLVVLSRYESKNFFLNESLSENRELFSTISYFSLININVILILFLSFLIFRNVTKLIIERRHGVLGAKLKTKLICALAFFAIAPTVLLFYISMQFITSSFKTWFSEKVRITMQQTREAGSQIYKQDQKRLQSLAKIAMQRLDILGPADIFSSESAGVEASRLEGFAHEYGISAIKVFDTAGQHIGGNPAGVGFERHSLKVDPYVRECIKIFLENPKIGEYSFVVDDDQQDVVKGVAPIRDPYNQRLLGVVVTEMRFETQLLKSIETIMEEFADIKPGAQLIRGSYMVLMIVVTLMIIFSATWMGFYVARKITGPLQSLAIATKDIALGNYAVALPKATNDEIGQLVAAFSLMTADLREHQRQTEEAQAHLQRSNEELEQRRQYMEIVLKNISTGVIALDAHDHIISVNSAAERLLGIHSSMVRGNSMDKALSRDAYEAFWQPIAMALHQNANFQGQLGLRNDGLELVLIASGTKIYDESNIEIGVVVVFDDASLQLRAQKVAAWREVARRIAHEIKNPITPIKLSAQRLLRRFHNNFAEDDREVFETCIETIITQVDSLRDLVNEFSKFSRLPSIKPQNANLKELLLEVSKLFWISYPEVTFEMERLAEVPSFPIDKEQLKRVFVNILTNALAALENGRLGIISIGCTYLQELRLVRIEIADNGCGIPKELRDRVLEPYFSTKDQGTGLGLAIVNQIISDHGGYLRLSAHEPRGTLVIIELPLAGA